MANTELIQIDTASMAGNEGLEYKYQIVINEQAVPIISLEGLRELRRLCDHFIRFGEEYEKSK